MAALVPVCPRCGKKHGRLFCKKLQQPIKDPAGGAFTHWGSCRMTAEPILLRGADLKLDSSGLAHPTPSDVR